MMDKAYLTKLSAGLLFALEILLNGLWIRTFSTKIYDQGLFTVTDGRHIRKSGFEFFAIRPSEICTFQAFQLFFSGKPV
ncbi:hypothetical protein [Desulfonatronum thioautotrophicum]|uniref:hypothetical protein n=1 Tax=Desulfonatronum thioautotrophicum TaxID=617001 RepID=UPI0012947C65|nr:hypothetical protein [Desulfonatronum thioautotrophicum]